MISGRTNERKNLQDDGRETRWELSSFPTGHVARFYGFLRNAMIL